MNEGQKTKMHFWKKTKEKHIHMDKASVSMFARWHLAQSPAVPSSAHFLTGLLVFNRQTYCTLTTISYQLRMLLDRTHSALDLKHCICVWTLGAFNHHLTPPPPLCSTVATTTGITHNSSSWKTIWEKSFSSPTARIFSECVRQTSPVENFAQFNMRCKHIFGKLLLQWLSQAPGGWSHVKKKKKPTRVELINTHYK